MADRNNIKQLMGFLPQDYKQACFDFGVIERSREIKNPKDLMTLIIYYLLHASSLLDVVKQAELLKICKISDVSFMKKFAKCNEWFKWIISNIIPDSIISYKKPHSLLGYKIILFDGSIVTERGIFKRKWRLHYGIDIFNMKSEQYKITTEKTGESLTNFDIRPDYLAICDRAYGTIKSIEHCLNHGANFILRLRSNAFNLYDTIGCKIDMLDLLRSIKNESGAEFEVFVKDSQNKPLKLRWCAIRKTPDNIAISREKIRKHDSKSCKARSATAVEINDYIVVVTTLPVEISTEEILSLYRLRWQVELYFKRFKSLLDFGVITNKKEASIESWLNGKLMLALLIEKFIAEASISLPPNEDTNSSRSIWRETKFIISIIINNLVSLKNMISSYTKIAVHFFVEKRKITRLQMAKSLS